MITRHDDGDDDGDDVAMMVTMMTIVTTVKSSFRNFRKCEIAFRDQNPTVPENPETAQTTSNTFIMVISDNIPIDPTPPIVPKHDPAS